MNNYPMPQGAQGAAPADPMAKLQKLMTMIQDPAQRRLMAEQLARQVGYPPQVPQVPQAPMPGQGAPAQMPPMPQQGGMPNG